MEADKILNQLESKNLELLTKIEEEINKPKPDYSTILLLKLQQYENISKYYSINMRFKEMQSIQKTCNEVVELLYKIDKDILQFKSTTNDDIKKLDDILSDSYSDRKFVLEGNDATEIENNTENE
jgi:hypothetical protein